jgi:flagellar motor switch protein FliG
MATELPAAPQQTVTSTPRATAAVSGRRKAAVLLAALGSDRAADVLQHLDEEEIESLSLEMAKMGAIEEQTAQAILGEVAAYAAPDGLGNVTGGVEFAREVLERALGGERAEELLGRLSNVMETRPFEFLRRTPPEQIATFLSTESPQMIAMVLANLDTAAAAQVLPRLPEHVQPDIALRIARMGETSPSVIQQVEEIVRRKLTAVAGQEYSAAGGVKSLADILNHADRSTERAVLDYLATTDGELAEEVRRMLFVFEDIAELEDRAIQQVLREADQKDLVLALRGVADTVKGKLMENMSERGAEMLKEEMEIQQPQRKRDVEAAQGRIVAVVRRLEDAGTIVIARGDGDEEEEAVV